MITMLQAREYVTRTAASELNHHMSNGSEWLNPEGMTEEELGMLKTVLEDLVTELDVRADNYHRALIKQKKEPIP